MKKGNTEKEQRETLEKECKKKGIDIIKESRKVEQAKEDILIAMSRDRVSKDPITLARTVRDKKVLFEDED